MYDHTGARDRQFAFHEVYSDQFDNAMVFDQAVKPLLAQIKQGYNATCFAYGMTGAGKTHTMFGSGYNSRKGANFCTKEPGIANLAVKELFAEHRDGFKSAVSVNFLEIYNEQVKDLLTTSANSQQQNLVILEDPMRGVVVQDLSEYEIEGVDDLQHIIKIGNERRTVAATGAN